MRKLRVAFGMEDEKTLSPEHFGDSKFFLIYDVFENGTYTLVGKRINTARKIAERVHGDPRKFKAVVELLKNVDILAAFRMGPNFLRIRDQSDKVPFITGTRKLDEALEKIVKNFEKLFIESEKKKMNKTF